MKILAIAASPRRNGNSETLLDRVLSGAAKKGAVVKKVIPANLNIAPCNGCLACMKTGECVINDDMQALYEAMLAADVLLVASPIYFKGLPCQLKCIIDRCQALWARKYILRRGHLNAPYAGKKAPRRGTAILVSASKGVKDMFTGSVVTLKAWVNTLNMAYKKEFIAEGLEGEADALKDRKLLKKALAFGNKVCRT